MSQAEGNNLWNLVLNLGQSSFSCPPVFWHSSIQNVTNIRSTHFANRKRDRNRIFTMLNHLPRLFLSFARMQFVKQRDKAHYIDLVSRVVFPAFFLVFNILYWTYYLVVFTENPPDWVRIDGRWRHDGGARVLVNSILRQDYLISIKWCFVGLILLWRIYIDIFCTGPRSNSLHLHVVFRTVWPNNGLAPFFGIDTLPGKSWIRHWSGYLW